jgi:hypothetical protein
MVRIWAAAGSGAEEMIVELLKGLEYPDVQVTWSGTSREL